MKLVKTIINPSYRLVGFWIRGKQSEFGGYSRIVEEDRPIQVEELIRTQFTNKQVSVKKDRIYELGNFKINELPMSMFDGTKFRDMDSSITLKNRILNSGELIGFKTIIDGKELKYKYQDVIRLSGWFKPTNFVIRSTSEKIYIAGKPGVLRLDQLPEEVIGEDVESSKRKRVGTGGNTMENIENVGLHNNKDILTLLNIVNEYSGIVVKFPQDRYIPIEIPTTQPAGQFRSLGIGEIANPNIQFSEKRINASTTFKKVGQVMVPVEGGMTFPVYTYTWTKKAIFLNGVNYMPRFAIAIKQEGMEKIQSEYKNELILTPIIDRSFIEPIAQLTGNNDLLYFEVDASKLSIIVPSEAHRYIMSNIDIRNTQEKLIRAKIRAKYCEGMLDELNEEARKNNVYLVKEGMKPYGLYAGLAPNYLKALHECGINIFNGAYTKREGADENEIKDQKIIEIEYGIEGLDAGKVDYAFLKTSRVADERNIIKEDRLLQLINSINSKTSAEDKFNYTLKEQKKVKGEMYWLKKKLWLHKLGMYYVGDGKVHQHDKSVWIEKGTRAIKSKTYNCMEYGCEGLYMKLTGIVL